MARTSITPISQAANGVTLNNAGSAIDQANGNYIAIPTTAIPAGGDLDRLVLYIKNSDTATHTVTIKAGVQTTGAGGTAATTANVPAFQSSKGDLVTGNLTGTTGTAIIGPFDVARFAQQDGAIQIDYSSGATGTVWAILLPRVI